MKRGSRLPTKLREYSRPGKNTSMTRLNSKGSFPTKFRETSKENGLITNTTDHNLPSFE